MAAKKTTETMIIRLEKKHPEMLFADSEANGLYYATCEDDDRIAVLCGSGKVILNLEQAYALSKEVVKMWDYYVGACRKNGDSNKVENRGRNKKNDADFAL